MAGKLAVCAACPGSLIKHYGGWGLERLGGNSGQNIRLPVETSRRTPHLSRDIYKMRNKNTTSVAVNTILGKGDKSFLAY
jgi:hypothetical protein